MQVQLISEIESIPYKHEVVFPTHKWQLYFVHLNILKFNILWKKKFRKVFAFVREINPLL